MPNWGVLGRPALFLGLTTSLWGLPACGLVVGFGERECVDECASGSTDAGSTVLDSGGAANTASGGNASSGSGQTTAGSGGETGTGSTMGGAQSNGAGGSPSSGGAASSGGTGGDTTTSGESTSGAGAGGVSAGGMGGTGGDNTGGTGGDNTGGTGGDGTGGTGTGGTGTLPPSGCTSLVEWGEVAGDTGVLPVQVASTEISTRDWVLSWRDGTSQSYAVHERSGPEVSNVHVVTSSAAASGLPLVEGVDEQVASAWSDGDQLTLHYMLTLAPTINPDTSSTPDLGSATAVATSLRAPNDSVFVVGGVHDGEGIVAMFVDGAYLNSVALPGNNVHSVAVVPIGSEFPVVYSDDAGLHFAIVASDAADVGASQKLSDFSPDTDGPESYVRAIEYDSTIAIVWLEGGRVRAARISTAGALEGQIDFDSGTNNHYPNLARSGTKLAVTWLDANELQIRGWRLDTDFALFEQTFVAAVDVAVEAYGLAGDELSGSALFAVAYNKTNIEFNTIGCD